MPRRKNSQETVSRENSTSAKDPATGGAQRRSVKRGSGASPVRGNPSDLRDVIFFRNPQAAKIVADELRRRGFSVQEGLSEHGWAGKHMVSIPDGILEEAENLVLEISEEMGSGFGGWFGKKSLNDGFQTWRIRHVAADRKNPRGKKRLPTETLVPDINEVEVHAFVWGEGAHAGRKAVNKAGVPAYMLMEDAFVRAVQKYAPRGLFPANEDHPQFFDYEIVFEEGFMGTFREDFDDNDVHPFVFGSGGGVPDSPQPLRHFLYFKNPEAASIVAAELRRRGFSVKEGMNGDEWGVRALHSIIPTEEAVENVEDMMDTLADKWNGEYDGWESPDPEDLADHF